MEGQTLINLLLGASCSVIGWFARELWTAVKELKSDLSKLREQLPHSYIVKDDYREDMREIRNMLEKIFDRLDNKQDR